ncbi:hypothetical protein [Streptomyces sp. CRN 30]|uniref:hypothetical protein n=1 Tax=Streptomyces sp. CRN 30 TaxID=3075613 RepID=UPI002A83D6BF|nr:hypothetical protein [Streptomyces sp. CRN 30]
MRITHLRRTAVLLVTLAALQGASPASAADGGGGQEAPSTQSSSFDLTPRVY